MEQVILQSLGYTSAEISVYLSLLKLGHVKVGKIIEASGLQSSTVHNTLHFLIENGLVSYILKGKTKIYHAVNPRTILSLLKEKEKRLEEIMPNLESIQKTSEEKQNAEIYEGFNGIISMFEELIKDSKPKEEYLFFTVDVGESNKEIQEFFERYDLKRKAKKIITKGIARTELKPLFKNRPYVKMKYINHPIPSNISICEDKIAMIEWKEKPVGVLIQSKQLAKNQKDFFNDLWKVAKK